MNYRTILKKGYARAYRAAEPWANYSLHRMQDWYLRHQRHLVLNCLGDSHNDIFRHVQRKHPMPGVFIRCTTVIGATVLGLANPNSKTNALSIFQREIRALRSEQVLSLMLGEVDCGFLIFLRSQRNGTSVATEMEVSLDRYRDFLLPLVDRYLARVIVFSVPPPTVGDYLLLGTVANLRREVRASIEERTSLTLTYNNRLCKITEELGFDFMDMDPFLIDGESGKVREVLLNLDPRDHHLNPDAAAPLYADALRRSLGLS